MGIAIGRRDEAGGQRENIERGAVQTEGRVKDGNVVNCDGVKLIYT